MHPTKKPAPPRKAPRCIERGKAYPLQEFLTITGWSNEALRNRRDEGLRVVYAGRQAWVSGDDFNDFILDHRRQTVPDTGPRKNAG